MPIGLPVPVRGLARLFLGGCLMIGAATPAFAQPTVAKLLEYQPRQEAPIATPTPEEQGQCKVDLEKTKDGSAWVLKDPAGRPLRRFYGPGDGKSKVDTWSYYKDGVEVYRETDTTKSGRPDQFRWLHQGGSKWGVDVDKDGKIDGWRVISPEEVSQEVLRALVTRNYQRLEALMITDADIQALGLPKDTAESLAERRKGAKAKFEATIAKLTKLNDKATWMHLELPAPECTPAEVANTRVDIHRYSRGTVLIESSGSNEWFQVGPMVQVGQAWKLTDGPIAGATAIEDPKEGRTMEFDPQIQKLVQALTDHDKKNPGTTGPASVKHHLERADILEKIVAAVKPAERDPWIRQVADSLASAAQAATTETAPGVRLASLESQLIQHMRGSNLTAYVVFRKMQAEYSKSLTGGDMKNFDNVQKSWMEKLTSFVQTYPKAEDAPDAMLQLGMVCEFLGKEVEAKNAYTAVVKNYPNSTHAPKAQGVIARLELEGQPMRLAAPHLTDPSKPFDIEQAKGKIVVVYYWASWNGQAAGDFSKLKGVVETYKDVVVVTVNLDQTPDEARAFLAKTPAVGTHLYQPGGLESKVATQYGVLMLPSVFVVGKDGKCLNKNAQISTLDDDIKKANKK